MPASAGLYAGQPLFDCVAVPSVCVRVFCCVFVFLRGKHVLDKKNVCVLKNVFLYVFAIVVNVDLNLKLKFVKSQSNHL